MEDFISKATSFKNLRVCDAYAALIDGKVKPPRLKVQEITIGGFTINSIDLQSGEIGNVEPNAPVIPIANFMDIFMNALHDKEGL